MTIRLSGTVGSDPVYPGQAYTTLSGTVGNVVWQGDRSENSLTV